MTTRQALDFIRLSLGSMVPGPTITLHAGNDLNQDAELIVERWIQGEPRRVPVDRRIWTRISALVVRSRVAAVPQDGSVWGLDGETTTLQLTIGMHRVSYVWWPAPAEPPTGWEPLGVIARRLLALARPLLHELDADQPTPRGPA